MFSPEYSGLTQFPCVGNFQMQKYLKHFLLNSMALASAGNTKGFLWDKPRCNRNNTNLGTQFAWIPCVLYDLGQHFSALGTQLYTNVRLSTSLTFAPMNPNTRRLNENNREDCFYTEYVQIFFSFHYSDLKLDDSHFQGPYTTVDVASLLEMVWRKQMMCAID